MENFNADLIREIKMWWIQSAIFMTILIVTISVIAYKLENDYKYKQRVKKKARKVSRTFNNIVDRYIEDMEEVA